VGWRWAFPILGSLGPIWALVFYLRYRETPTDRSAKPAPIADSDALAGDEPQAPPDHSRNVPWKRIFTNLSVWGLAGATFCSAFSWFFCMTWLPTYLKEGRHLSMGTTSWMASLPLLFGVAGCWVGGWLSDELVRKLGSGRWARRIVGSAGAFTSAIFFLPAAYVESPLFAVLLMSMAYFCNDLTLSCVWAACMDVGERYSGSVSGVVNTASAMGSLVSTLVFGRLITLGLGWTPVLLLASGVFVLGGFSWLLVDPTRPVSKSAFVADSMPSA
jgi:MFS transporter, ACS family, glucarate transporter